MTLTKLVFVNPFGDPNDDHETPDPLCLARVNFAAPMASTLEEFYGATIDEIDKDRGQVAFFLIRQLTELALKALHGPGYMSVKALRFCHDLETLLEELGPAHDLVTGTDKAQDVIVSFIKKLAEIDPKGDEGRYPFSAGLPALNKVCHAEKDLLRLYADLVYGYTIQVMQPW